MKHNLIMHVIPAKVGISRLWKRSLEEIPGQAGKDGQLDVLIFNDDSG